jgi:hypothetical protein
MRRLHRVGLRVADPRTRPHRNRTLAARNRGWSTVYIQKQRHNGKTSKEAIRSLKRHLVRRVYHLLRNLDRVPTIICLT